MGTEKKRKFKWASELRADATGQRTDDTGVRLHMADVLEAEDLTAEEYAEREFKAHGWPPALRKAAGDLFEYSAAVAGFGVVHFTSAKVLPDGWAWLGDARPALEADRRLADHWQRGLEVRVSSIVWVDDGGK